MDSHIESAVEILANPRADAAHQQQAFEFLDQLNSNPEAWQACTALYTRNPRPSDPVRMACLEIINFAINTQALDLATLTYLKDTLLDYVRRVYGPAPELDPDPPHLQNKLSQTLTYLFVFLYQDSWQTFIDDFLALTGSHYDNVNGVLLYLRVLGSIHDEIADMLLTRQSNDTKRNADLKDQVRAQDMQKIARSWKDILSAYTDRNDAVVVMVMKVLGKWVSWMDISLVIGQDMMGLLLPVVGRSNHSGVEDKVRNLAIDTLTEICAKKMKLGDKMTLIAFLNLHEIVSRLVASPPLAEYRNSPKYNTDLAEAVAKLVNTVMSDVVRALEDTTAAVDTRALADQHLKNFVPYLLRFFSDEYDEVCSTVISSLTDLLTALRKIPDRPESYGDMLPAILNAVIVKMRYDETSNWGSEDEQTAEAEFQDLRKKLRVLQKSIEAVDQDLYIDVLSNLVANTFQTLDQQGSNMDWRDLELALHEMYHFGELALPSQGFGGKKQPSTVATERLAVMMAKMVQSGVAHFGHPAISLQYLELCARYADFFESHEEHIPQVLENFVRLLHHNHVRLRQRSWYLFYRIVRHLRAYIGNVSETVIHSISDLLPIKAEVPSDDADDDMSSDETDHSADALFQAQLYLYQAIGLMATTRDTTPETRAMWLRSVMDPLFGDMEQHLPRAKSGEAQALLQIHHIIMALGTLAHGLAGASPGAGSGSASAKHQCQIANTDKAISDEFARAAEAILIALRELNTSSDIRLACRAAFAHLLGVLGATVLQQLPQWIEGLLSRSSSKDEMAMFLRLLDQVIFGFKGEIYDVLNHLLTPLLQCCFGGLSGPINGTDDQIQLVELRREYLSFLQNLLANKLEGVFVSDQNQAFFEPMISSILEMACNLEEGNMAISRIGFNIMTRIAAVWGGPDVAAISDNPTAPSGPAAPAIAGFDAFLVERFHEASWKVMQNPQFKPAADAQSKQLLAEIAGLEQMIYLKTGDLYIQSLSKLGIDEAEFMRWLSTSADKKALVAYLSMLLRSRR